MLGMMKRMGRVKIASGIVMILELSNLILYSRACNIYVNFHKFNCRIYEAECVAPLSVPEDKVQFLRRENHV